MTIETNPTYRETLIQKVKNELKAVDGSGIVSYADIAGMMQLAWQVENADHLWHIDSAYNQGTEPTHASQFWQELRGNFHPEIINMATAKKPKKILARCAGNSGLGFHTLIAEETSTKEGEWAHMYAIDHVASGYMLCSFYCENNWAVEEFIRLMIASGIDWNLPKNVIQPLLKTGGTNVAAKAVLDALNNLPPEFENSAIEVSGGRVMYKSRFSEWVVTSRKNGE